MFIDTHAHIDGEEFADDLPDTLQRAREAGVSALFVPAINEQSIESVMAVCRQYPGYCYPMIGLQPEEVDHQWQSVLDKMHAALADNLSQPSSPLRYIAIGECGLDFYWSRDFENEQLKAFERQVEWSVETRLPLMIHCRKAQNELLHILRPYAAQLPGGVFHCFTGNAREAEAFLQLPGFCLGIGGVSTFKSSHLREDLPAAVPVDRLVLETDCPYMAPVPYRGKRNEPAYVAQVLATLARSYGMTEREFARATNQNVQRIFGVQPRWSESLGWSGVSCD